MPIINQIKNELEKLGIKPKQSLGQNFLINDGVYHKIIAGADIKKGDQIIEVGPGLGTLTQYLLDAGAEVLAIEKDHVLSEYLKIKFDNEKRVKIIEGDILKFNPADYKLPASPELKRGEPVSALIETFISAILARTAVSTCSRLIMVGR